MKSINCLLLGLVSLTLTAMPVQADTRVGVVNTVRLMEEAPQAKAAQSKIETEFSPRERELVNLQKSIRKLEDRLSRDGAVMSEKESSKLEREILSKRRELKRTQDEFRDDLNIRKNEVLSRLQRQMYEATVALAKEKKFDIILGQGVVYSSDSVDVTNMVLDKLKVGFKAGDK
ncbi:MAG: OmpH family outer membrane protein [Gammaproteobacteria bacterium]|nr:MAG: OmpH family outer membrane protein [Gammaproteobacteria bacterium]